MWIKQLPGVLGESSVTGVNFLYNKDKVYVMDNHLCAAWCWLQKVDVSKRYNFVHIDYHYDLSGDEARIKKEITEKGIRLHELGFEDFCNLKFEVEGRGFEAKLFRWDNFILNTHDAYPGLFASNTFITKRGGSKEDFVQYEEEIELFMSEFQHWLNDLQGGWIIDLDIDFFLPKTGDSTINCIRMRLSGW